MQVIEPKKVYPVIVIGSGASGGMAAWNLTQKGIDVLLLDAGDKFDRSTFWTHVRPWEAQERTARGERPPPFFLDTKEQPYLTAPGRPFALTRVWGHGGKTNVWGRVSLRYSEMDLKAADRDGWELLIELMRTAELDEIVEQFERFHEQEQEHVAEVRQWLGRAVLGEGIPTPH